MKWDGGEKDELNTHSYAEVGCGMGNHVDARLDTSHIQAVI